MRYIIKSIDVNTQNELSKKEKDFREQENIIPFNNYDMYKATQGLNTKLTGSSYKGFIFNKNLSFPLINISSKIYC